MTSTNGNINGKLYKVISTIGALIVIVVFLWAMVNDYFNKTALITAHQKSILELQELKTTELSELNRRQRIIEYNLESLLKANGLKWEIPIDVQMNKKIAP